MADDTTDRTLYQLEAGLTIVPVVIGAVATFAYPTDWTFTGFIILALLAVSALLHRLSPRAFGFAMLGTAGFTAAVGQFLADSSWPMHSDEFSVLAVGTGTGALAYVFIRNRTGETDLAVQDVVGIVSVAGLLALGMTVAVIPLALLVSPLLIVSCEALGGLADLAGERWKNQLAIASILPIFTLILVAAPPGDIASIDAGVRTAAAFVYRHSSIDMLFAMVFAGGNAFLVIYRQASNASQSARGAFLFAALVGLLIFSLDVDFSK